MLEILNINPINKGSLLATCSVHIKPWKLMLHDVKIFEKGANRWVAMPSKEFKNENTGEIKYTELMVWDTDSVKNSFRNQVMAAVDKFMASNPELKLEDAIKATDELPF